MERYICNDKTRNILTLCTIVFVVMIAMKYILPLVWPFIFSYYIGKIILKIAGFLNEKMQFKQKIAIVMATVAIVMAAAVILLFSGRTFASQTGRFIRNWPQFQYNMEEKMKNMCCNAEDVLRMDRGKVYDGMCKAFDDVVMFVHDNTISVVMKNGKNIIVIAGEILAAIVVSIMGAYFYARDKKEIQGFQQKFMFSNEIKMLKTKVGHAFKTYIRAQLVIMAITIAVCTIGFTIIRNPYSLLLGVVVGMLDALPLIGLGLIMIPWIIISFLIGNVKKATVILITYIICYIVREVLEPKIMGNGIGINPLVSLICIYAGYKVFGLLGVVLGPIAFVIIMEIYKIYG